MESFHGDITIELPVLQHRCRGRQQAPHAPVRCTNGHWLSPGRCVGWPRASGGKACQTGKTCVIVSDRLDCQQEEQPPPVITLWLKRWRTCAGYWRCWHDHLIVTEALLFAFPGYGFGIKQRPSRTRRVAAHSGGKNFTVKQRGARVPVHGSMHWCTGVGQNAISLNKAIPPGDSPAGCWWCGIRKGHRELSSDPDQPVAGRQRLLRRDRHVLRRGWHDFSCTHDTAARARESFSVMRTSVAGCSDRVGPPGDEKVRAGVTVRRKTLPARMVNLIKEQAAA